jgi:hypothetical protein
MEICKDYSPRTIVREYLRALGMFDLDTADQLKIAHAAEVKSLKNETESTVARLEKEVFKSNVNTTSLKELAVKKDDDMASIRANTTSAAIEHHEDTNGILGLQLPPFRVLCTSSTKVKKFGSYKIRCKDLKLFAGKYFPNVVIEAIPYGNATGKYHTTILVKSVGVGNISKCRNRSYSLWKCNG